MNSISEKSENQCKRYRDTYEYVYRVEWSILVYMYNKYKCSLSSLKRFASNNQSLRMRLLFSLLEFQSGFAL